MAEHTSAARGPAVWWIEEHEERLVDFHQQTLAWVTGLGLDPSRLAPRAAVVQYGDIYELHVDEIPRDEHRGGDRIDPCYPDEQLKQRRIIRVEKDSWPSRPSVVEVAA